MKWSVQCFLLSLVLHPPHLLTGNSKMKKTALLSTKPALLSLPNLGLFRRGRRRWRRRRGRIRWWRRRRGRSDGRRGIRLRQHNRYNPRATRVSHHQRSERADCPREALGRFPKMPAGWLARVGPNIFVSLQITSCSAFNFLQASLSSSSSSSVMMLSLRLLSGVEDQSRSLDAGKCCLWPKHDTTLCIMLFVYINSLLLHPLHVALSSSYRNLQLVASCR